ncbi:MAG TPA: prolipoprotein diacylglyceryl transferase [Longimicrobium sp.]
MLEIRYPFIDPVAIDLPGPLDVRWYGLGYMAGFGVAYYILRRLAQRRFLKLDPDAVGDLIFALMLGVILGGRLGYILFYDFSRFAANPLSIVRIWEGGLAFHGGLLGVIVAGAWFARKHRARFLNLGDSLALGVCPGIFAVRVANFVNGELYGRIAARDVPWAVRFPADPKAAELLGVGGALQDRERVIRGAYESGRWDAVRAQVPLRHPSQLYEALGEGLVLGVILWLVYRWSARRGHPLGAGFFGGVFMLGYGVARTFIELFRQPDVQFTDKADELGTVLGPLTMGQTLSLLMIAVGIFLVVQGWRKRAPRAQLST